MTLADGGSPPQDRLTSGPRVPALALVLVLVALVGAGAAVYLLLRPHLVFTNTLSAAVRVVVGDDAPRIVAPGAVVRVLLARSRTMVAQWELVRPLSADGTPMGDDVRGSSVLRGPSGTVRASAGTRSPDHSYFAPLITNASAQALRMTVNAGLQGALDCGCAVRPGARRVFIGYYRLYQNSSVGAYAAGVGSAVFRDLGAEVRALDGSLGLRFEDKDLRR
ncbi:MAG: hypothetical protein ABIQ49_10745 [Gemmatimonadales bacterium]